jgi:hypothetical protein
MNDTLTLRHAGVKFASPVVIEKQSSLIHGAIQNGTLNREILAKIVENDPEALNHKVDGQTPLMAFVEMVNNYQHIYHLHPNWSCRS